MLAIDIGNTHTVLGLYRDGRLARKWRLTTMPTATSDEIEIRVEPGAVVITAAISPRAGWADAAAKYAPGGLLDAPSATRFDDEEWTW
mgnify:CR=1 FL=1